MLQPHDSATGSGINRCYLDWVHRGGFDFEIQVELEMGADPKVCLAVIPALAQLKVAATNVKRGRENRTRRRRYRTPDTNNRYLHPILMPVSCSINILSSVGVTILPSWHLPVYHFDIYQVTSVAITILPQQLIFSARWQLPVYHLHIYHLTTVALCYHRGIDHLGTPQRLT